MVVPWKAIFCSNIKDWTFFYICHCLTAKLLSTNNFDDICWCIRNDRMHYYLLHPTFFPLNKFVECDQKFDPVNSNLQAHHSQGLIRSTGCWGIINSPIIRVIIALLMTCPCRTSVIIWWFLVAVLLDEELIVWIRYCIGCTHNAMAHFVHDCRGDKRRTKRFSSLSYASVVCTYGNVPVDKSPLVTTPFFAWIGFPCNKAGRTFSNCLLLGMWKTLSFRRQSWSPLLCVYVDCIKESNKI